jgi:hypothetical protein
MNNDKNDSAARFGRLYFVDELLYRHAEAQKALWTDRAGHNSSFLLGPPNASTTPSPVSLVVSLFLCGSPPRSTGATTWSVCP